MVWRRRRSIWVGVGDEWCARERVRARESGGRYLASWRLRERSWECAERASVLVSAGSPKEVECGRDEEEEEGQWRRRRGVCAPVPPVSECHLCTLMLWRSVGRGRDGSGRMRLVCTARLHPFALCGGRGGNRGGGGVESECPGGRNVCMALGACWWGVRRDKGEGASALSLSECSASVGWHATCMRVHQRTTSCTGRLT